MRFIGLDVHRDWCDVAIYEDGKAPQRRTHHDRTRPAGAAGTAAAYLLASIVAGLAAAVRVHPRPRWAPHSH